MCYAHLTQHQRYQIEGFIQAGQSAARIASKLGVHRATVYRERRRGSRCKAGYVAWYAQEAAERRARRSAANHPSKPVSLWRLIRRLIRRQWSPEAVRGYLERFGHPLASVSAIYAYLRRQRSLLNAHLRYGKRTPPWGRHSRGPMPLDRPSIHSRPAHVKWRRVPGHWEGDTLMGNPSRPHRLLALVERCSRYLLLRRPQGAFSLSRNIAAVTVHALRRLPLRSLTFDNGAEFSDYRRIAQDLDCNIHFADTHSPWQRGTCENTIGLVRQYIPKGTSGAHLTLRQIRLIQDKLNHRPRKCLGYKTPAEVLLQAQPPVALRT